MSIDFMVFDPAAAPRSPRAFRAWYRQQTDWSKGGRPWDESITGDGIRAWYREMTEQFPDANRAKLDKVDETYGDYNFGPKICYVAFRPKVADDAWSLTQALAAKYTLGTYDPNSDDENSSDCIQFPDGPLVADPPARGRLFDFLRRRP